MSRSRQIYIRWGKRALDVVGATLGLILLSPLMMVCAILVRLTSTGPIFFRQLRPGLHARPFKVFKFRTMREGAEKSGASIVIHNDSRLTAVGAVLRALKLDEIPQLINIIVGDMSFVGPRPRPPENIVNVDQSEQSRLFSVRPGITSYATVYHHNEEEYCNQQNDPVAAYRELQSHKCQLDEEYLENLSLWVDLKLILLTLLLIFPGTSKPTNSRPGPLKNYHSERVARMAADSAIFAACVWVAYWLRFDGQLIDFQEPQRNLFIVLLPIVQVISYSIAGVYDMVWRYVNRVDFSILAAASGVVSAIFLIIRLTLLPGAEFPHILSLPLGVIVLDHLLALGSTVGVRAFRRSLYELGDYYQPWPPRKPRRILILGAGRTGLETALAIKRLPHTEVVGFLDDDPAKDGCLIGGCRVVGNSKALREVIHSRAVSDLLICVHSIANFETTDISESCRCCGVRTHLVTTVNHILGFEQFDGAHVLMDSQTVGEL
jgi:lipopolysaccharide/colanic/teichoic acid biosynthesis glycosyltransferase